MTDYIEVFINFLPHDKQFARELVDRYRGEMEAIGEYLEKKSETLWCKDGQELMEFLDLIDGNGFEVSYVPYAITRPYKIVPLYPKEIEIEVFEVEEEAQVTVTTTSHSFGGWYIPVYEETLYDPPVEVDTRYILEREKLRAPRPLWICLRRRLEFLRLVSTGWSRSASLPRPP
jgi:hypothetical protein